jgi:hypothetical protein
MKIDEIFKEVSDISEAIGWVSNVDLSSGNFHYMIEFHIFLNAKFILKKNKATHKYQISTAKNIGNPYTHWAKELTNGDCSYSTWQDAISALIRGLDDLKIQKRLDMLSKACKDFKED